MYTKTVFSMTSAIKICFENKFYDDDIYKLQKSIKLISQEKILGKKK